MAAGLTISAALSTNVNFANDAVSALAAVAVAGGLVQTSSGGGTTLTVAYDAASQSYTLTDAAHGESFAHADLVGITPVFNQYQLSGGDRLTLYSASPSSQNTRNFVGLGVWSSSQTSGGTQTTTYDTFTYGNPTPASAMPRTGGAAYNIDFLGFAAAPGAETRAMSGAGWFNADFYSGVFSVLADTSEKGLVSGTVTAAQFTAGGALSSSDSTFSGTFSYQDPSNYSGSITGRIYGPGAQEVGASFTGSNGFGGTLAGSFFGAQAGGIAPGVNLSVANFFVPQTFVVADAHLSNHVPPTGAGTQYSIDQLTLGPGGSASLVHGAGYNFLQDATFTAADIVPPSRPNFTTYQTTASGAQLELDLYKPGPANTELALTYAGLGLWYEAPNPPQYPDNQTSAFVFGMPTSPSVLSALTGSAHYEGVVYGNADDLNLAALYHVTGTSTFDVNFSSQTLSGSLNLTGARVGGGAGASFGPFTFSGAMPMNSPLPPSYIAIGPGTTISYNGTAVGEIQAQFFGPAAEEAGGSFTIVYKNAAPDLIAISGAAVAKRR